jgi:hypothetical protein
MSEASLNVGGQVLPADRFHAGVRLAVLGAWVASVIVVFLLLRVIVSALVGPVAGVGLLLLVVVAVAAAQPLAMLAEKFLMQRWPSGRAARLAPGRLSWQEKTKTIELDLRQKLNYWRWQFEVRQRRSGRVPTGHHCLAMRLVQGENEISLYSFVPPAKYEALRKDYPFYELRRSSDKGKQALGGRDALFLAAEHTRWETGAELDPADFEKLLAHLDAHLEGFRHSPTVGG